MRTAAVLMALLGLSWAASAAEQGDVQYDIVGGEIIVFGHTLTPAEPLPETLKCDDCDATHSVGFVRSPDERWILIISEVHLANFNAWLFDTRSKGAPHRIADKRRGRHFTGVEWHSGERFELAFGGMGYSTSLLFDATRPGDARKFTDLLLYDVERDVYVRYLHDFDKGTDNVEIGNVFSADGIAERFPIMLDNEYLSESRFMIESVEIDGTSLVVTYDTRARGKVREVFDPRVLME
jgi:hypothetical protein